MRSVGNVSVDREGVDGEVRKDSISWHHKRRCESNLMVVKISYLGQ